MNAKRVFGLLAATFLLLTSASAFAQTDEPTPPPMVPIDQAPVDQAPLQPAPPWPKQSAVLRWTSPRL